MLVFKVSLICSELMRLLKKISVIDVYNKCA